MLMRLASFGMLFALSIGCAFKSDSGAIPKTMTKEEAGQELKTDQAGSDRLSDANSDFIVIGHLKTRGEMITILTGKAGRRYTVKTKGGELLPEKISGKELQARYPRLHRVVDRGFAGSENAVFIDATYRPHAFMMNRFESAWRTDRLNR